MTNTVKEFIEGHKNLIDNSRFYELLEEAYEGFLDLNNQEVNELVGILSLIGVDLSEIRQELLYDKVCTMLEHTVALKETVKNRSLHKSMHEYMNNWYGYSQEYVTDFIKKNALNLGIDLIYVGRTLYSNNDYQINFL